jgi:GNAT superfamily N-acetyltransferase
MAREMGATIREFQRTDLAALKTLVHRTITTCYPGHYFPEAVQFFIRYHEEEAILRDAAAGCTVVLDQGGRLLGTGTLVEDEIKRVFVAPAFQQQGLGRRILRHLEERATLQGVRTVTLDASLPSKAFYDRLGYVITAAASRPVENGQRLDFFKMRKALGGG